MHILHSQRSIAVWRARQGIKTDSKFARGDRDQTANSLAYEPNAFDAGASRVAERFEVRQPRLQRVDRGDLVLHPAFGKAVRPLLEQIERKVWRLGGELSRHFAGEARRVGRDKQAY